MERAGEQGLQRAGEQVSLGRHLTACCSFPPQNFISHAGRGEERARQRNDPLMNPNTTEDLKAPLAPSLSAIARTPRSSSCFLHLPDPLSLVYWPKTTGGNPCGVRVYYSKAKWCLTRKLTLACALLQRLFEKSTVSCPSRLSFQIIRACQAPGFEPVISFLNSRAPVF